MSSTTGAVLSMVSVFSTTVSLPWKRFQSERSRAITRKIAGPSLRPVSFDDTATTIFFSATAWSNCSVASVRSLPPAESVAVTDFNPAPGSLTAISIGARPSKPESGVNLICGASRSKRGARKYPPPRIIMTMNSNAKTI